MRGEEGMKIKFMRCMYTSSDHTCSLRFTHMLNTHTPSLAYGMNFLGSIISFTLVG